MIEFYIRNGNKEANLKVPNLSAKQLDTLINRSFDVLLSAAPTGGNLPIEPITKAQVDNKQQQRDPEPEHWKTGILHREGVPYYRLRLECPNCGLKKNLYREMGLEKVECEQCKTAVWVEPATEKGFGTTEEHRDQFGNFMVARKPYSRPRQLPIIGSENRSTFPVAELIRGDANAVSQAN